MEKISLNSSKMTIEEMSARSKSPTDVKNQKEVTVVATSVAL